MPDSIVDETADGSFDYVDIVVLSIVRHRPVWFVLNKVADEEAPGDRSAVFGVLT